MEWRSHSFSIHAPREGSDAGSHAPARYRVRFQSTLPVKGATPELQMFLNHRHFSIHAPREGSDSIVILLLPSQCFFQSTLPVKGATSFCFGGYQLDGFSIHAPREGSDGGASCVLKVDIGFSIHAPREGSDGSGSPGHPAGFYFQSTLPVKGATYN